MMLLEMAVHRETLLPISAGGACASTGCSSFWWRMVLVTLGDADVTVDGWAGRMMGLVGLGAEWVL